MQYLLIKYLLCPALVLLMFVGSLHADETMEETKPEGRAPVHLDKITIVIEGQDVLKQEGIHEWAGKASKVVAEWYPKLDKLLETEGFVPGNEMSLVFRRMDGVAFASGTQIVISSNWIRNPAGREDFGMVAHELVHVIQRYPGGRGEGALPGWLMEGVTDYIRHAYYEPDVPMRPVNPDSSNYDNSYQITGGFLMYLVNEYDKDFVAKLNVHGRQRSFPADFWEQQTGKKVEELWTEYVDKVLRPQWQANQRVGYIPDARFPKLKELRQELDARIAASPQPEPQPEQQPQRRQRQRPPQE